MCLPQGSSALANCSSKYIKGRVTSCRYTGLARPGPAFGFSRMTRAETNGISFPYNEAIRPAAGEEIIGLEGEKGKPF